jgi:membrane protein DedA with SNARE-associated domain
MAAILDQIRIFIEEIISALGYPGITFVMLVENIFPPIPSEVVMPFAGFLVVGGRFTFLGIVLAGTLGSVLGASRSTTSGCGATNAWSGALCDATGASS